MSASKSLSRRGFCAAVAGLPMIALALPSFPEKPVTIVIGFPPGGPVDVMARGTAQSLSQLWGQPVIVDPKPGANGILAAQSVLRSRPDGLTILLASTGLIQSLTLVKPPPYNLADFASVGLLGRQPSVLLVPAGSPYQSMRELFAAIKQRPESFSFGSTGIGASGHIYGELLNDIAGVKMPHVAYRGEAPLLIDLIAGRIAFTFISAATAVARQRDGTLRTLAVTGTERLPWLPNVPTMTEAGLTGFQLTGWYGMFVSSAVPSDVVQKLSGDLAQALREPRNLKMLDQLAIVPISDEERRRPLKDALGREFHEWDSLIKRVRIST